MYNLNPIVALPPQIPMPKGVMYDLPKIQGVDSDPDMVYLDELGRQEINEPKVDEIENKQVLILKELFELQAEIDYLWMAVRLSDVKKVPPFVRHTPEFIGTVQQDPIKTEVVLYSNPKKPPFFIPALQRLWSDVQINVKTHRHSSVPDKITNKFEELLLNEQKKVSHTIDVRIIWKDVKDIQLFTEVHEYLLEGEGSILQYLARLIQQYNYEDKTYLTVQL